MFDLVSWSRPYSATGYAWWMQPWLWVAVALFLLALSMGASAARGQRTR